MENSYRAQVDMGLTQEVWMQQTNINPNLWTRQGDRWFFTGEPSQFNQFGVNAPESKAFTAMMIRTSDFTNINVDGPFVVQLFGHQEHNSVFVIGPNESARQAAVEVRGNTLYVHQPVNCVAKQMDQVIIRIGLRNLNNLMVSGCGKTEGTQLYSTGLNIKATGSSNVLLSGNINLHNVTQFSNGTISVIGAYTPSLDIRDYGNGTVNVSGRVGIHSIAKSGAGNINIVGADSDSLVIDSSGSGTISIAGFANLKKVNATQASRVYLYWVNSNGIYVNVHDRARVGLAGVARNVDIETDGYSRFEGKYLRSDNTYVRTRNWSHANVSPVQKLFANSLDNSSIYFFGSPNVVSRYTMDAGIVVPVWNDASPTPAVPPASSWSWGNSRPAFTHHSSRPLYK